MRTLARLLGIAVVLAGGALGSAGASSADQTMQGNYTYTAAGQRPATWTIYPVCVNVVGDLRVPLELPVACQCTWSVPRARRPPPVLESLNWGGDAH